MVTPVILKSQIWYMKRQVILPCATCLQASCEMQLLVVRQHSEVVSPDACQNTFAITVLRVFILQYSLHMPWVDFTSDTPTTQNSRKSWGMCRKHCCTHMQHDSTCLGRLGRGDSQKQLGKWLQATIFSLQVRCRGHQQRGHAFKYVAIACTMCIAGCTRTSSSSTNPRWREQKNQSLSEMIHTITY